MKALSITDLFPKGKSRSTDPQYSRRPRKALADRSVFDHYIPWRTVETDPPMGQWWRLKMELGKTISPQLLDIPTEGRWSIMSSSYSTGEYVGRTGGWSSRNCYRQQMVIELFFENKADLALFKLMGARGTTRPAWKLVKRRRYYETVYLD